MKLYHMSRTLQLGDEMVLDYDRKMELAEPFIQALERGEDCFWGMYLNAKYLRAVLVKFRMREWSNYVKWSVEGVFEYIRRTEYPDHYSRLRSNYFFDNLPDARAHFQEDWGGASQEEQDAIHLYEIELEDAAPQRCDIRLFDEAYGAMSEQEDLGIVLDCARRYFSGKQSPAPVWEILSDKSARAVRDLSDDLKNGE